MKNCITHKSEILHPNESTDGVVRLHSALRDWSLIMGRGVGAKKREGGGHMKFYPYRKWGRKSVSHAQGGGGGTTSFGVVFTR